MSKLEEQDFDEKRLARRKKRKRSQLIAYILLIIILVLFAGAIGTSIHFIRGAIISKRLAKEAAQQIAKGVEDKPENMVIETPDEEYQIEEYTPDEMMTDIVEDVLSQMPLEDKVAGLFIITPEQITGVETAVKAGSGTQEALSNYAVGGIVYSSKNIKETDQIKEMLGATSSMSKYPIFTILSDKAVLNDQVVSTLGLSPQAEITDEETAYSAGATIGSSLYKYNFNMAMLPKVEIGEESQFGAEADVVKKLSSSISQGLQESGISACGYAFPMIGDTATEAAVSDKTKDDLVVSEYEVFKSLIDNKTVNAVQMSNISLPQITGDDTPATLSEVMIREELRGTLGFEGIVVTAPLNEGAVTGRYSSSEAAIAAIKAGADMLFLPDNFVEAYEGVLAAVTDGSIGEERINESLRRILGVKYADKVSQISGSN